MKIIADLHTHTISSGHAYSTIKEIMAAAKSKGLDLVAITDHGPAMTGSPHNWYFSSMKQFLPSHYEGMAVLYGIEANIMDAEGSLDLEPMFLEKLDLVLAGLHEEGFWPGSVEENTRAMIKAMENPLVDIIVHPGNPSYVIDQEKVARAALDLGVALEVNNSSLTYCRQGSYGSCLSLLKHIKRNGSFISLGSDAHWADHVGNFSEALAMLAEVGVGEEQILNTAEDKIRQYLAARRKGRNG